MKTTLAIALLGAILACSVPTSANQSHLRQRLIRETDEETCPLTCDAETGGNVLIRIRDTFVFIYQGPNGRFILVINVRRQYALYINLDIRLVAVTNLATGGTLCFEPDTGNGIYVQLEVNVTIDVNISAQALYTFGTGFAGQIVSRWNDGSLYRFNVLLVLVRYGRGETIRVIFSDNVEIGESIQAGLGEILEEITNGFRAAGGDRNTIAVVRIIVNICVSITTYRQYIVNLCLRLPASLDAEYVSRFITACRHGGREVVQEEEFISGAASALGAVSITSYRNWTINNKDGSSYTCTLGRDKLQKYWSLVIIPAGIDCGAFEMGLMRNFIFIFNKRNNWVIYITIGRIGIFNMVDGVGLVLRGRFVAIVENSGIRSAWETFLTNSTVPHLQAGLSTAFNVTITTKVGRDWTYTRLDNQLRAGHTSKFTSRFLRSFALYISYLREYRNSIGLGVVFIRLNGLERFGRSVLAFANTLLTISGHVDISYIANRLYDTLRPLRNIADGFKCVFSARSG